MPTRYNRFFGTMWKTVNKPFGTQDNMRAAIYISCVDSVAARVAIAKALGQEDGRQHYASVPRYWMDFGGFKLSPYGIRNRHSP